jgi:hypothetical protein
MRMRCLALSGAMPGAFNRKVSNRRVEAAMRRAMRLFGERSLTLVAATFEHRGSAVRAADALRALSSRKLGIFLVAPRDPRLGRKMEPESNGIWHTLLRSHAWLGPLGALAGLAAAALLWANGWPAALASPLATLALGAVYGGFAGLLAAGLLTLRPDRARVIAQVRDASDDGHWSVVSHPVSAREVELARATLANGGGHVMRSL